MLDNASNQTSKFRTKIWVKINDESRGTYSVNRQINFKTSMPRSSLCDCSDAYILAKGNTSVNNTAAADADANNTNKKVISKNSTPMVILLILIEPMSLTHLTRQANDDRIINIEIMVPLKCLRNFWRTLEMSLINCKINLSWQIKFLHLQQLKQIFHVPAVTLLTQDNAKLLPQLESGFKRTINWNKYLLKPELLAQNPNLNQLVEPSFQGINILFVLAFENDAQRTSNKRYYLTNVEIKNYNVMIDGKKTFDQPMKNDKTAYQNIRKIATGRGVDYTRSLLFIRLYLLYRLSQNDCSRFK